MQAGLHVLISCLQYRLGASSAQLPEGALYRAVVHKDPSKQSHVTL
jgi:hypothetical protein